MSEQQMSILVIEDDDVAIEGVIRSMEQQAVNLPVVVASDGHEALSLLRGTDQKRTICTPVVILLDLNMAGMNGLEFLEELRADPDLHRSVVFVWTTSDSQTDRRAAYEQHVAGYLVKSRSDRHHSYLANLMKLYQDHLKLVS